MRPSDRERPSGSTSAGDRALRFGAHVPTHGRLWGAIEYALAAGCETFQMFVSNPRGWAPPNHSDDAAHEFRRRREAAGIRPAFAHSSYLINIASPGDDFRMRSIALAHAELDAVEATGLDGLVVHAGAGGPGERPAAVSRAADSVRVILGEQPDGPALVLELTAGGTGTVASTIPDAAELVEASGRHPRIRLCLDTCHLFAAGYPLDRPAGIAQVIAELRRHRLLGRLALIHANDARDPCGSRRDRHAFVGQGFIGEDGFRAILGTPELRRLPALIETPGKLEEDRRDLATLRRLAAAV